MHQVKAIPYEITNVLQLSNYFDLFFPMSCVKLLKQNWGVVLLTPTDSKVTETTEIGIYKVLHYYKHWSLYKYI